MKDLPIQTQQNHIARTEQPEVHAQWIRPERICVFGVPDGDMAALPEDVGLAGPVAEDGGHVLELEGAVGLEGDEFGDGGDGGGAGVGGVGDGG